MRFDLTSFNLLSIPGLAYVPNYLDPILHDRVLRIVDSLPWQSELKRRVQHYGYTYDYRRRTVERIGALPDWAAEIAIRLAERGLGRDVPDQLIVNEYQPGQGIAAHVDMPLFADMIVSISLGSACVMEFTNGESSIKEQLRLEPRSALVLSGEARSGWRHSIPARKRDKWHGTVSPRTRRVSLTFRKVL